MMMITIEEIDAYLASEDEFPEVTRKSKSRIRHNNEVSKKKHNIKIANNRNFYRCGMWYDEDKKRLHDPGNIRASKEIRVVGNRMVRKSKKKLFELPKKGNHYKKLYEYWWEIT